MSVRFYLLARPSQPDSARQSTIHIIALSTAFGPFTGL
ncbi:hypothetical protein RKLH11_669 [Rhodobacteraceae bacterium KLH11]|nr:hypothetical protein RKLH11_669 [Rhodobacteraceae bacterium KLH11]